MRIAVIGGGPGGLFFAALARQRDPQCHVDVFERNESGTTYGFGVVFSDETLDNFAEADPRIHADMASRFVTWQDIDTYYTPDVGGPTTKLTSTGHAFAAMSRVELLNLLSKRCLDVGVNVHYGDEAPPLAALRDSYDLVVGADGVRSQTRNALAEHFRPTLDVRHNRYIWLGTSKVFDSFTFDVRATPHGVMQLHAYPYGDGSTAIVEMREDVWRRANPTAADCTEVFADRLDGHSLHGKGTDWIDFATVRCSSWSVGNVVLLGDAAHTAHFSIGSGTKLAMEDAAALADAVTSAPTLAEALASFETTRRPVVESTQRAAQASLEWFEDLQQYLVQHPTQFGFNLLTRSRRITYDNLRLRDPRYIAELDAWFAADEVARGAMPEPATPRPPMFQPFRLGPLTLKNRVIVSPMDMYSSDDGVPGDFHLVHLGSKALGGAGLVMTEMVCVSESGRITPGCAGLYDDEQQRAWKRIVEFVHANSDARIGVQLGHSGRKGSTKLMWDGIDEPLPEGNWPLVAASPLPYRPDSQTPGELTREQLAEIRDQFADSARRAREAGFDLLELHCAHGYLLSGFISPLTNRRTDEYGGDLANRLRFPLEVLAAIREVWDGALTVRISATDWCEDGITGADSVEIARAFAAAGVDGIDVSTGQVVVEEKPAYGRSYQTPYADRIRHALRAEFPRLAVIAVGAISSADDANSIILAGRADLCALGRVHLYDPHWTLHAAAEQEFPVTWPKQFRAGARKPPTGRG
ncbi:bifunctional salicylyl-CoA 5-hydroxylase/oxidoreductase [Stackebrandtia nassauensis]|uniref:NADH:flavin oxidoreductase/NADH oxidase n=1 Tax=Stackebrandtia nassauensis (strain DSM 44728 / CIP 108903 / NRRL B-16338 / NBRC 102104 / LLR-40K-21) TaxID=446470 RepID=D3Q345_STANL|nr:bifunctional salicylyl-CoA 5-hydroxylase/oxidoreductase [Stackebrandtia nassauensis]ADD40015.1 NADH:flavin oxidoreductase/NADH oxidase [Stackebrandtia nassauensis DSM 44728]